MEGESQFDWESSPNDLKINISDLVIEGKLLPEKSSSELRFYAATTTMLIRYSVF